MPKRIAITELNATTLDILNVIHANASSEYRSKVPTINDIKNLPKVGEVIMGYPALQNEFVMTLVNRIASVRVKSVTFNNMFADLKKGYVDFGEVVEEVFVNLTKAREFSVAKASKREFERVLPDVRSAFHSINYKVQYPMTIQNVDLRQAFLSESGVLDLIAKIVDSMYKSNEYDEFLMFKYLIIKAVSKGKMFPIGFDGSDMKNSAVAFRSISNNLMFVNTKYNSANVHTNTPKKDQQIFMDTDFNARYDVNVLASAFNMDKTEFMGRLRLIDDFTTFDNDRFSEILEESDMLEPITEEELALMRNVKGVLVDQEWFQYYDNLNEFTETFVSSGLYWNYNLTVWRTISSSPFSNAIVFVDTNDGASTSLPAKYYAKISGKQSSDIATIFTIEVEDIAQFNGGNYNFIQTDDATIKGIAVHKYGAYIFSPDSTNDETGIAINVNGIVYGDITNLLSTNNDVGDTFELVQIDGLSPIEIEATESATMFEVPVSSMQDNVEVNGTKIVGTLKYLSGENAITNVWGAGNFLCLDFSSNDWSKYTSVKVGLDPSQGSGLVEILTDPDKNGVFKIKNKSQKFVIEATNNVDRIRQVYSLNGLTLQKE